MLSATICVPQQVEASMINRFVVRRLVTPLDFRNFHAVHVHVEQLYHRVHRPSILNVVLSAVADHAVWLCDACLPSKSACSPPSSRSFPSDSTSRYKKRTQIANPLTHSLHPLLSRARARHRFVSCSLSLALAASSQPPAPSHAFPGLLFLLGSLGQAKAATEFNEGRLPYI